jgi:hypothetical protein
MTAKEKVDIIVMNAGSGQRTPSPTRDESDAAIIPALFKVSPNVSFGPSFFTSFSSFF